jgi:hypothetical protein
VQYGGGGELQAEEVLPAAGVEVGPAREVVASGAPTGTGTSRRQWRPDAAAHARGGAGTVEDGHQSVAVLWSRGDG